MPALFPTMSQIGLWRGNKLCVNERQNRIPILDVALSIERRYFSRTGAFALRPCSLVE